MVIDRDLIERKMEFLRDFIRQIEHMDFDLATLEKNVDIQHLLAFRLQQAVEHSIDIATHIIAGLELPREETAKDAFSALAREGIIGKELARKMGLASDFRNLVVHGYGKIDLKMLYQSYKEDLDDLRKFAKQVNEYISG